MRRATHILAPLCLLTCLLASPRAALAQSPVPDDVAPPLSFCIGSTATCVSPDFRLSVASYDLDAKKWSGGVQDAGAGYKILFWSDTSYASGLAAHATFNLSQATPNYVAATVTAVLLRYFEVGVKLEFGDGYLGRYLVAGTNVPLDLLGGGTLPERLRAARLRASRPEQPAPTPPTGGER